jgi:hypothetical protein
VLAFFGIVCVTHLRLGGLRGKKSTSSVGWEVSVRSHRSTSRSQTECTRDNDSELSHLAMVRMCIFLLSGSLIFSCAFSNVLLLC